MAEHQTSDRLPRKRLDRLLSNLGYCSRSEAAALIADGYVAHTAGKDLRASDKVCHEEILFDGAALDPEHLLVMLNKPRGCVCSRACGEGPSVFELMPERYWRRSPELQCVGRLDRDTTGLLLLTDDGSLLHRVTAPHSHLQKVYLVTLRAPVSKACLDLFKRGGMLLEGDKKPLAPVEVELAKPCLARMTLHEGRYHQIKRMWEQAGNEVIDLHRSQVGALTLGELSEGSWRMVSEDELFGQVTSRSGLSSSSRQSS